MIKLAFTTGARKIIRFDIDGPKVIYYDDIWANGIQIYPKDTSLIIKLKTSRKPTLQVMAALILDANKGKDLAEYNSCKGNEGAIADFVRKDCITKGLMEVK